MKRTYNALGVALLFTMSVTSALAQTQTIRAFAHRGGRMERDENTLEAFQESWDGGYTGFETDIRMSRDGVLYIMHDESLDRTTNGHGILEEMLSSEIDTLRTKRRTPTSGQLPARRGLYRRGVHLGHYTTQFVE